MTDSQKHLQLNHLLTPGGSAVLCRAGATAESD